MRNVLYLIKNGVVKGNEDRTNTGKLQYKKMAGITKLARRLRRERYNPFQHHPSWHLEHPSPDSDSFHTAQESIDFSHTSVEHPNADPIEPMDNIPPIDPLDTNPLRTDVDDTNINHVDIESLYGLSDTPHNRANIDYIEPDSFYNPADIPPVNTPPNHPHIDYIDTDSFYNPDDTPPIRGSNSDHIGTGSSEEPVDYIPSHYRSPWDDDPLYGAPLPTHRPGNTKPSFMKGLPDAVAGLPSEIIAGAPAAAEALPAIGGAEALVTAEALPALLGVVASPEVAGALPGMMVAVAAPKAAQLIPLPPVPRVE